MAADKAGSMLTAAKLAESLQVSQGKVKKLIDQLGIEPDDVKGACKYYGPSARKKLESELKKAK
jgi:hypothetical protein